MSEHAAPSTDEREVLADILMADDLRVSPAMGRSYALAEADAILAAGFRRGAPAESAKKTVCTCWRLNRDLTHQQGCDLAPAEPAVTDEMVLAALNAENPRGATGFLVDYHESNVNRMRAALEAALSTERGK